MTNTKLTILRLLDGKLGHEKQSQALLECMLTYQDITAIDIPVKASAISHLFNFIFRRQEYKRFKLNSPRLIIGAGHKTHIPMLFLKWRYQCKSAVIMTPSLPLCLFDFTIIPEHDRKKLTTTDNVLTYPLAIIKPIDCKPDLQQGLVLLGGKTKNIGWDEDFIIHQVYKKISKKQNINWNISTSRRTPKSTIRKLIGLFKEHKNIKLVSYNDVDSTWLESNLKRSSIILVTLDSISMTADAFSSDAEIQYIVTHRSAKYKHSYILKESPADIKLRLRTSLENIARQLLNNIEI